MNNDDFKLTPHQDQIIRQSIQTIAKTLLGIPYEAEDNDPKTPWTGKGKWMDLSKPPTSLDCSGLVAGVFKHVGLKMPHGSKHQFNFTLSVNKDFVKPGDLAFFGYDKDIHQVYHVGLVLDSENIIESRKFDPKASFETGKVILRPKSKWEAWDNFLGYRAHPRLV